MRLTSVQLRKAIRRILTESIGDGDGELDTKEAEQLRYLTRKAIDDAQDMIQSAGVIIVDREKDTSDPLILCLRAYNNWGFPKGRVEQGETKKQAAARETLEETGLKENDDWVLTDEQTPSITYGKGKKKKTASYFMAYRLSERQPYLPVNPELGHPEHDEWRWVPASKLYDIMPRRLGPVIEYIHQNLAVLRSVQDVTLESMRLTRKGLRRLILEQILDDQEIDIPSLEIPRPKTYDFCRMSESEKEVASKELIAKHGFIPSHFSLFLEFDKYPINSDDIVRIAQGFRGKHAAIDIAANKGTSIYAIAGGEVEWVKYNTDTNGYGLSIDHGAMSDCVNHKSQYVHMLQSPRRSDGTKIKSGEAVEMGEQIGRVGTTSGPTGDVPAHLHFQIRQNGIRVDPMKLIEPKILPEEM